MSMYREQDKPDNVQKLYTTLLCSASVEQAGRERSVAEKFSLSRRYKDISFRGPQKSIVLESSEVI